MRSVNIHEAKTHLSRLLDEVARGEGVIIAKAGRPVARLLPLEAAEPTLPRIGSTKGSGIGEWRDSLDHEALGREVAESFENSRIVPEEPEGDDASMRPAPDASRRFGFMKGRITVPDDFDAFGREEIAEMFGLKE